VDEFLVHGVPHAFPGTVGQRAQGVPTGGGAPILGPLAQLVGNDLVWATRDGPAQGRSVEPLDPRVPEIALRDQEAHALLAAVDLLRVGRARARRLGRSFLEQVMLTPEPLLAHEAPSGHGAPGAGVARRRG
jgi:hypothetical protein